MISPTDVEKLAKLARISITDAEKEQFGKEIDSILGYVGEIQNAAKDMNLTPKAGSIRNIVREDVVVETDSKNLIEEAPHTEGDFIAVKKILS